MKILNATLEDFSYEKTLRQDFDFHSNRLSICENYYTFDELFDLTNNNKLSYADIEDEFYYCEIGDVDKYGDIFPQKLDKNNRNYCNENYFAKIEKGDIIRVDIGDILLSKVRPNLKKFILINDVNKNYYFTSAFLKVSPKKLKKIIYYCLRNTFYKNIMAISRQGKGYPTINDRDVRTLRFDKNLIDKLERKEIELNNNIAIIENQIADLKKRLKDVQSIVDEVLQKEFNFDYDKFNQLKKVDRFNMPLDCFALNPDLRFSAKFHRPAGDFVMQELLRITSKKFKHFLAEPIVLGASISPSDFDENGDFYYISMATIKNWAFNTNDAQFVSNAYSAGKKEKTIKKDDIILARSGEGTIGKVALIEEESLKAVFADFTMRIRLINYNVKFAYYYMRGTYFQYLVEIYKKGLGNNTNIFPIVIREFPLIDIPLVEQQRIVEEIQTEIDKQNEIKNRIAKLRRDIDQIIENAMSIEKN